MSDGVGHWHLNLMFFIQRVDAQSCGARLPDSPIVGPEVRTDCRTIFLVPVTKRSDGPDDSPHELELRFIRASCKAT